MTSGRAFLTVIGLCLAIILVQRWQLSRPAACAKRHAPGHVVRLTHGPAHIACFARGQQWKRALLDQCTDPCVVLLHGMGAQLTQFETGTPCLVEQLVKAGYCVLSLDMWGHGFSSAPDIEYKPYILVQQIREAIQWSLRCSTRSFAVLGFSHGGFLAALLAHTLRSRVTAVILAAPYDCNLRNDVPFPLASVGAACFLCCRGARQFWPVARMMAALRPELWTVCIRSLRHSRIPMNLIVGEHDDACGMRMLRHALYLKQRWPNMNIRVVPGCGHVDLVMGASRFIFASFVLRSLANQVTAESRHADSRVERQDASVM